jgi:hypothetical protein
MRVCLFARGGSRGQFFYFFPSLHFGVRICIICDVKPFNFTKFTGLLVFLPFGSVDNFL